MVRTRKYLEKGVIGQVADDTGVAIRMRYVGTGTVTSVTVTAATGIVIVTSDGGTDSYTWAAYTTYGALEEAINKDGVFEARVMDCLRSTATGANLVIGGVLTADSKGQYDMLQDTSNTKFLAYRMTVDRTFGMQTKVRDMHRVHIKEIITNVTCGGAGADVNSFKIYECSPLGNYDPYSGAEILVYQKTPTSGSSSTLNWASGYGKITATEGNDLVVIINDATSITGDFSVFGINE